MKPYQFPRPGYVTLRGGLFLFQAGIALLVAVGMPILRIFRPLPPVVARVFWQIEILMLVAIVVYGVLGVFLLLGANWARITFFILYLPGFIIAAIMRAQVDPATLGSDVLGLIVCICWYVALTQPRANRYFTGRSDFFKSSESDRKEQSRKAYRSNFDY